MSAKIFYFTLQDEQTKEEKLEWFENTPFEKIPFDHITPDKKANWINLTDNDFDNLLPLIDKEVKAGRSEEAVFQLFSAGVKTQRDEWVYDFSKEALTARMKYFVEVYQERLKKGTRRELDIKWDRELEKYFSRSISKKYQSSCLVKSSWRPFTRKFFYFDKHFNGMTYQMPVLFPDSKVYNPSIFCTDVGTQSPFMVTSTNCVPDLHLVGTAAQCLPLYRYDESGNRIDNITDWALEQFRNYYRDELTERTRGLSPLSETVETPLPETVEIPLPEIVEIPSAVTRGLSPLSETVETPSAVTRGHGTGTRGLSPLPESSPLSEVWFVTFVTHNSRISERMVTYGVQLGEPLVFSAEHQIFIAQKIAEAVHRYGVEILAFNVLPDHVHMVITAETEKALNEKVRKIKGFSSYEFQRSQGWEKGQHVWAQKFNRQLIQDDAALISIIEYIQGNHIKHAERWGDQLISTWENGLPDKELSALSEIVQEACIGIETMMNNSSNIVESNDILGTRGLSPLPTPQFETLPEVRSDITKLDIFHYTYAVLHHPAYRTKYEINLKREFPRLPFYANFHQWATWGKSLMDLHLNYETIEPYDLKRVDASSSSKSSRKQKKAENATIPGLDPPLPIGEKSGGEGKPPKAKLKANKTDGKIILDTETTLEGIPALAWDYKLGNRSALEWILDQYKEKTPKDPTIRELFNTYQFADYKDHVIDLLKRVCTVSLRTMEIIHQMPDTVDHQDHRP